MINLDITGFYYRIPVEPSGITTVLDLLNAARGSRAPNGGVLDFRLDFSGEFIETIAVEYDDRSNPESRQENLSSAFPKRRPQGLYSFTDDVTDPANRIVNPGRVPGLHAWQYYIFDAGNQLRSRFGPSGERGIAPVVNSDQPPFGVALNDGDTVVWRLVGIFGLNHFFDFHRNHLISSSRGRPVGFKSAIKTLTESGIDLTGLAAE
ncbi:MAG: hypothetical protein AAFX06_22950 [Planctomycetota bacterium]